MMRSCNFYTLASKQWWAKKYIISSLILPRGVDSIFQFCNFAILQLSRALHVEHHGGKERLFIVRTGYFDKFYFVDVVFDRKRGEIDWSHRGLKWVFKILLGSFGTHVTATITQKPTSQDGILILQLSHAGNWAVALLQSDLIPHEILLTTAEETGDNIGHVVFG